MRKSYALQKPRGTREVCDICGKPNAPTEYGEHLHTLRARLAKFTNPEWIVLSGYAHQMCYKATIEHVERLEGKPEPPAKRGHCCVCGRWGGGWEPDLIKSLTKYCRDLNIPGIWTLSSEYVHTRCSKQVDEAIRDARARLKRQPFVRGRGGL